MKNTLRTYELTTEILNLISSTKSYCYIVSPYIKTWPQLDRILEAASRRNTFLTFVIREDKASAGLVEKLNSGYGFEVIVIKDLHIKLYLNEKKCILSSMNLYDASQQNNLELGYYINNVSEIRKEIIEDYILTDKSAIRYPGKFENNRKAMLTNVSKAKEIISLRGFCVDCSKHIGLDIRSYPPFYIRCGQCYHNKPSTDSDKESSIRIKYCHYCGQNYDGFEYQPLHEDCDIQMMKYKAEIKNFQ